MIRYRPKWFVDQWDGYYWACKKPGGGMAKGRTREEAKANWRRYYSQEADEYSDDMEEWVEG